MFLKILIFMDGCNIICILLFFVYNIPTNQTTKISHFIISVVYLLIKKTYQSITKLLFKILMTHLIYPF